ncbi:MAG: hypothetical protein ACRDD7_00215 [Peptostreptococcaceae bacterium]
MSIDCLNPLEIEFTSTIEVDCSMMINYDFNQNEDNFKDFKITVNASKLYLNIKQEEEALVTPVTIPAECAHDGQLVIDKVTLNKLYVNGSIDFLVSANLLKNSTNVTVEDNIDVAWPSTKEQVCVGNTLLAYANSMNDVYNVLVTVKDLHLHKVDQIDSKLDIFYFMGKFVVEPVLVTP